MPWVLLEAVDFLGTVAFAISGALVGISRNMDLFGVELLAVTTACGGGLLRDVVVGNTPPNLFRNPFYAAAALLVGGVVFLLMYLHARMGRHAAHLYEVALFWFDTLGLAAFSVDGVMVGVRAGFRDEVFLLAFLGFLTGVGGGLLRDLMADRIPDICVKHVYALAAVLGATVMALMLKFTDRVTVSMLLGFATVLLTRILAVRFDWNLPRVERRKEED